MLLPVGTGVKIARAAAIAATVDGPLPVGDVIAAGILIGGGIYLIGDSMDWWWNISNIDTEELCPECNEVAILDGEARICYECWSNLMVAEAEEE